MERNPYAPPTAVEPQAPGLVFSSEGVAVVTSMAKWMRGLAIIFFITFAFMFILAISTALMLGERSGGVAIVISGVVLLVGGGVFIPAGMWLRDAAEQFENGVIGTNEFSLARGFRKLRAYLILFGIIEILSLFGDLDNTIGGL